MTRFRQFIKERQSFIGALLVPIPILVYWIYWTLNPSYWFNADPAAQYFIDSLSVFNGNSYVYVDHPGTPVQLIGSLLLAFAYPFFESKEAFIRFFLSRPNVFFFMTNVLLLGANVLCVLLFYRTALRDLSRNRVVGAAALSLLFFALHPHSFSSLTFWSHNSFNFPFGTLLLIWMYRELQNPEGISNLHLFLMGLAVGIFVIAQVYFFAWLIAMICTLSLYAWRRSGNIKIALSSGVYVIAGALLGIILMLLPIYQELPRFLNWLMGIVTHLGLYGSGENGIYSLSLLSTSISFWWISIRSMVLLLLGALIVLGIYIYWTRRSGYGMQASDFAMTCGVLFQIVLILLVLSKAALKLRYSLSLAAILPVFVFLVIKLLHTTNWKTSRVLPFFYGLALLGVLASLVSGLQLAGRRAYIEQDVQVAKVQAMNRLAQEKGVSEEELVVVYTFSVPLKCAGLLFAANWIGNLQEEVKEVCVNQEYAFWDSVVEFNSSIPLKPIDNMDWDLVIWSGNDTSFSDYMYSNGATLIPASWHVRRNKWFYIHADILQQ